MDQILVVLNIGFSLAIGTPELIPDPDGFAQCLSKTMRPDSWIREQECRKLQASSLTVTEGFDRINLERNNMDTAQLKRIADAIEEILRLVKKDMEPRTKKKDD